MKTFLVLLLASTAALAESAPTTLGRVVQFHSQDISTFPAASRLNFNGVLGVADGGLYTNAGPGWTRICTVLNPCDAGVTVLDVTGTTPVVVTPTAGVYNVSLTTVPVTKGGTSLTSTADDNVLVGASASSFVSTALPACGTASSALAYDTSTNAFSCNTISSAAVTNVTGTSPVSVTPTGTVFDVSLGTVPVSKGGTNLTSTADDSFALGSGASTYVTTALPSCSASTSALAYNTGTNAFSCNTIPAAATVTSVTGTSPISVTPTGTVYDVSLGTVPVAKGGTGITSVASNQLLVGSGSAYALSTLPSCANGPLAYDTGTGLFACPTLPVTKGGTNLTATADDQVLVGASSSSFVSTSVPNVPAGEHLVYTTASNAFSSVSTGRTVWGTYCPAGVTCATPTTAMLSWLSTKNSAWLAMYASINTITAGAGGGNLTIHLYNATDSVDLVTCTIACTSVVRNGAGCDLGATAMTAAKNYRVYAEGCTASTPDNYWINVTLQSP